MSLYPLSPPFYNHPDANLTMPSSKDTRSESLTRDDSRDNKSGRERERKRLDEMKDNGASIAVKLQYLQDIYQNAKSNQEEDHERRIKDLPDTPMIDVGSENPKIRPDDEAEYSRVPESPSKHSDKSRDTRHQQEREEYSDRSRDARYQKQREEKDRRHKSHSTDDHQSQDRFSTSSRSVQGARDGLQVAKGAATHAMHSQGQPYSGGPAPGKPPKEENIVQKTWNWCVGGNSYSSSDPHFALPGIQGANVDLMKENATLKKTLSDYQGQKRMIQNIQNERNAAQSKLAWLETENQRLRSEQETQSSQVRIAQELMLKNKSAQGALADEDRTIRKNLRSLQTSVKDWGKDWSHGDITKIDALDEEKHTEAMRFLSKIMRVSEAGKIPKGMSTSDKIITRAPALVLSALLSNELCESVFNKPFRLLEASTGDPGASERRLLPRGDDTLDVVYRELTRCDEAKAQSWRCQTLEILDPSVPRTDPAVLAKRDAERRRTELAKDLSDGFLNGPAVELLRTRVTTSEERKRINTLEVIFTRALEMSARLWKQPTILSCRFFQDLDVEQFKNGSDFMEAHPLHQLGVRGEDEESEVTRLDDHQIMMAVSPAIIALGNSDGENYSQHRVWAKGVVWLEE